MNSRELLLAGRARMDKKFRSFRVGRRWFTLKLDDTTGTGCNIYFDGDCAWLKGPTKPFLICEYNVDMYPIMDAVIMWFLYPDDAVRILEKTQ
jgi:hypothetical protein